MTQKRILVVEDEAIVALDIKSRLKRMGYDVVGTCATGEEGVSLTGSLRPDLVLMDIMLAGDMDGIEATRSINDEYGVPVVYLTAYADKQTLDRAKITNPFGYVIKPFEDRELQTALEMALYKFEADNKMRLSERWLATTLRSLGEAVLTAGPDGLVRFMNPVAERVLGLTQEQAGRLTLQEAFWQRTRPMEGGERAKRMLCLPDGRMTPVETSLSPIIDDWSNTIGSVLVIRDISEQLRNEQVLRDSLERLSLTLEATVGALAVTAEKRDPYTAGHQQRVAALAVAMARDLDLGRERLDGLRVGGLLHDIGKIYIPAEILAKPSRLTSIEMGLIRTHSEVGYDILKDVPFPWPVARMVLEHHERIDGSGYPGGLRAEQILEESKILSVADVVEAMSSHRPYRAALGLAPALEEIRRNRGVLYDPDAVDVCVALFESGRFSFDVDLKPAA